MSTAIRDEAARRLVRSASTLHRMSCGAFARSTYRGFFGPQATLDDVLEICNRDGLRPCRRCCPLLGLVDVADYPGAP